MTLTFGSVFAGIGGLDLGLERAGMVCKWQIEIDDYATRVLEKHWPNVKRYRDVRRVAGSHLDGADLICGGFPCQPFSSASRGRKRGTSDNRWLWPQMCRLVAEVRPRLVLGENVTQLDDGVALDTVVSDLVGLGYDVPAIFEIPACAVGCDHWRPRLWILGYSDRCRESGSAVNAETSRVPRRSRRRPHMGGSHGIPSRLDRCSALGNAVVPQVAEAIGRMILAAIEPKPP